MVDIVAPVVADLLQLVGGQFDLYGIEALAHDALGKAFAGFDLFSFGHAVADVAGQQFEDAVQQGPEKALDKGLFLGMEGAADLLPDVQIFEHPDHMAGYVVGPVVGLGGLGHAPVEHGPTGQGGHGRGF